MTDETPWPAELGALADSAASAHEMYLSYIHAGFTPDQAMQLTLALLTTIWRAHVGGQP